ENCFTPRRPIKSYDFAKRPLSPAAWHCCALMECCKNSPQLIVTNSQKPDNESSPLCLPLATATSTSLPKWLPKNPRENERNVVIAVQRKGVQGVQEVRGVQGQTGDRIGFFNAGSNRGALRAFADKFC